MYGIIEALLSVGLDFLFVDGGAPLKIFASSRVNSGNIMLKLQKAGGTETN